MARQYKTGLIITGDASGGIRAIQATNKELGQLNKGFDHGSQRSKQFTQNVGETSSELQVLRRAAAPVGALLAGMFAVNTLRNQVNFADQLQKTNLRIGASTEALSEYNYVAKLSGVQFNQLTTGWQRQTRRIAQAAQGTGEAQEALKALNLNAAELASMAPEDQFEAIAQAMQGVANEAQRVALAQKLWDSEGVALVQIVNQGTDAITAMRGEAERLGLTISQATANDMAAFNDEMERLGFAAQGVSQSLLAQMVPSLTEGLQSTNALIDAMGGAEAVMGAVMNVGGALAVLYAGRLTSSIAKATAEKVRSTAATIADTRADALAAQAKAIKATEALRVAQSEQSAAQRALANSQATVAATGSTVNRTRAISLLAAANQRVIAAEAAHTTAINAQAAAMTRASVVSRGFAGALALLGGPVGAAIIGAGALYYFREELGLVQPELTASRDRVDELTGSVDNLSRAVVQNRVAELTADLEKLKTEFIEVTEIGTAADSQRRSGSGVLGVAAGEVGRQAQAIRDAVDGVAEGIYSPETQAEIMAFEAAIASLEDHLESMGEAGNSAGNGLSNTSEAAKEAEKRAKELASAWQQVRHEMDPLAAEHDKYVERYSALNELLADGTIELEEHGEALRWAAEQYVRAATGAEEYEKQTKSLVDQYDRQYRKAEQLEQALVNINAAYRNGDIDGVQYQRMVASVREEMHKLAIESDPMAQEMQRAWTEAANRIDETFADAFQGAFDSFDSFADQLMDGFKRLLAELAYQATLKPIVVQFTQGMQGMLGLAGQGTGGGSLGGMSGWGSLISTGKNLWGYGSALLGGGSTIGAAGTGAIGYGSGFGAATATGTYTGWAGSAAAGASASGGGVMSGLSSSMGSAASMWPLAVAMGMYQSGKLYDAGVRPDAGEMWQSANGNVLGQIGNVAPTLMSGMFEGLDATLEPIVGGKIAAMITGSTFHQALWGGINKALFGGAWETKDGGLALGASGSELNAQSFTDQKKKGGWFSSDKHRTKFADLDAEASTALQAMYESTVVGVAGYFDAIGHEIEQGTLDGFSVARSKISTKGKTDEEIEQLVTEWFGTTTDSLVSALSRGSGIGDLDFERLVALADGLTAVNATMAQLGGTLLKVSPAGALAAESLLEITGGLDNLAAMQAQYYEAVYDEQERQAQSLSAARDALLDFNDATGFAVESGAGLRHLVDSIDLATDWGRELYVQAMALVPAIAEVERHFERLKEAAQNATRAADDALRQSYGRFADQAFGMQARLLDLAGEKTALLNLQRERELAQIDASLRPFQERLWQLEDETEAVAAYNRELEQAQSQLDSVFANIVQFVDQLRATGGSPGMNLEASGSQFARQLALAESGDRDALQSITQYADRYLQAAQEYYASGTAAQMIQDDVIAALEDLPNLVSAEQLIADEVREAMEAAQQALGGQLDELSELALAELARLESLMRETENGVDRLITIDSSILSVRDAVLALGVAQEEIARIERDRLQAEKREREQIAAARAEAEAKEQARARATQLNATISNKQALIERNTPLAAQYAERADDTRKSYWSDTYLAHLDREAQSRAGDWDAMRAYQQELQDKGNGDSANYFYNLVREYAYGNSVDAAKAAIARAEKELGNLPKFAKGGAFTSSVVSDPTLFNLGQMGEAGPEAIMPLHRGADGSLGIRAELPPIPALPLLGRGDIVEAIHDLKREVAHLRAENRQLLEENNRHAAAGVNLAQAGFQRLVDTGERTARSTEQQANQARLENLK